MDGGHIGAVSAVAVRGGAVVSAGEDGFLEVRRAGGPGGESVERFQVTERRIVAMAARPGRSEVSLVETDGRGAYRVSAWDYGERRNIFQVDLRSPVSHVSYSTGGSFVIAGAAGLALLDADSGAALPSPAALGGAVALAVTGRAERNMMAYLSTGWIVYRDLGSGAETARFSAPANLSSPAVFGHSRFIAGLSPRGLVVVDALSGRVVATDETAPAGALLSATDDALYVLASGAAGAELRRKTINQAGHFVTIARSALPALGEGERFTSIGAGGGRVALGTSRGGLFLAGPDGQAHSLAAGGRARIIDAAASGGKIAFLAEGGTWGFIPLDYAALADGQEIGARRGGGAYNRVTPFAPEGGPAGQFIFWQDRNAQTPPSIRAYGAGQGLGAPGMEGLSFQFPLRSVASFAGRAMFMDSAGNISVVRPFDAGAGAFSFSSAGLVDAAFLDGDRLILGRSALSGGTPFLSVNVATGETVPLPYPAQAGIALQRGASGDVFAAAVSRQRGETSTSILRIDPANPAGSERLASFEGERARLSLVEAGGGIAAAAAGEGVALRLGGSAGSNKSLERTPGFPIRLIDGSGGRIVSLDADGNLAWHDAQSGGLLALFRLGPSGWALQTRGGVSRGGL